MQVEVVNNYQSELQRKREIEEKEKRESDNFQRFWAEKNSQINANENQQTSLKKSLQKNFQDFNNVLVEEKNRKRLEDIRQEMQEAEEMENFKINENLKFHTYAEKCLKDWSDSGKTVLPLINELKKHKNDIVKLIEG